MRCASSRASRRASTAEALVREVLRRCSSRPPRKASRATGRATAIAISQSMPSPFLGPRNARCRVKMTRHTPPKRQTRVGDLSQSPLGDTSVQSIPSALTPDSVVSCSSCVCLNLIVQHASTNRNRENQIYRNYLRSCHPDTPIPLESVTLRRSCSGSHPSPRRPRAPPYRRASRRRGGHDPPAARRSPGCHAGTAWPSPDPDRVGLRRR